jgi:hypothetical protein
VTEFIEAAHRYCAFLDGCQPADALDFLKSLYPLLAELAYRVLRLPDSFTEEYENVDRSDARQRAGRHYSHLYQLLGQHAGYWEVFDPSEESTPIRGSVPDDLADIYGDLLPGLQAWPSALLATRLHIIWEWRFSYGSHWGHHLIDAMRYIHSLGVCS